MKYEKAAGPDGIESEHLLFVHPRLVVLLYLLINSMLMHGRVHSSFGLGIILSIIKGPSPDNSWINR